MSAPNIAGAPLPQRARGYWKARIGAAREGLERLLEAERAQLPPWLVVGFGSGIAAWFALDARAAWSAFLCIAAGAAIIGFALTSGRAGRALGWFALAASLGCALVWVRSDWVRSPRLTRPVVAETANDDETGSFDPKDEAVVATIKELLETRVRPAVAQDGGDIAYKGYRDGRLYLSMHGACSGCPSSTVTLKRGIESLIRHYVPEVETVEAV